MEELQGKMLAANSWVQSLGPSFAPAFISSLFIIVVSELGDKTFFIAALMSMKHGCAMVFGGAISALALMTVIACLVGHAVPQLLNRTYTHYASVVLFAVFGVRMLYEAYLMDGNDDNDELAEVEAELSKKHDDTFKEKKVASLEGLSLEVSPSSDEEKKEKKMVVVPFTGFGSVTTILKNMLNPVFLQAFSLTFVAEWGDRSQIATVVLAAAKNVVGVTIGSILGHSICTGIAVLGGKMLATRISERLVTFIGATLFLAFAIVGIVFDV